MPIYRSMIERSTSGGTDILDLTSDVERVVGDSAVAEGSVLVFAPGATAAITTLEFESGAIEDLRCAIERMAPRDLEYRHDQRWGDGNGYSHVRAALMGPSLVIPVSSGRPLLGTWQQIVLCDFDNRPRKREILVQVSGVIGVGQQEAHQ